MTAFRQNYYLNERVGTSTTTDYDMRYCNYTSTNTASGTVLDFAWNNPNTTFLNAEISATSDLDNSRCYRRFRFNGTAQQLQAQFNDWTTTTWTTTGGLLSRRGVVHDALMKIFEEPTKEIKKQMSKQEKKLLRAKRKSELLLKKFLSPNEYNALKRNGELEIKSKVEDEVIFIVKKNPHEMVDVKKNGKYSHKLCAVSEDLDMPIGDQLLSKLLLIKSDEKAFREVAIRHG